MGFVTGVRVKHARRTVEVGSCQNCTQGKKKQVTRIQTFEKTSEGVAVLNACILMMSCLSQLLATLYGGGKRTHFYLCLQSQAVKDDLDAMARTPDNDRQSSRRVVCAICDIYHTTNWAPGTYLRDSETSAGSSRLLARWVQEPKALHDLIRAKLAATWEQIQLDPRLCRTAFPERVRGRRDQ